MVLFLDRVYGIENQDFLLHVLDVGFLPDMRAAASLDTVSPIATLPAPREDREIGVAIPSLPLFVLGLCIYPSVHPPAPRNPPSHAIKIENKAKINPQF